MAVVLKIISKHSWSGASPSVLGDGVLGDGGRDGEQIWRDIGPGGGRLTLTRLGN